VNNLELKRLFRWRKAAMDIVEIDGSFLWLSGAIDAAERLLPTFRGPDGDHEGMVFLMGKVTGSTTLITTVIAPAAEHSWGRVMCDENAIAAVVAEGRERGLALVGQLHAHGGDSTVHSDGDDHLITMPFEGMLSLIAPHYGRVGLRPLSGLGVHQHCDGRWVLCDPASVAANLRELPEGIDLR
jgi:hypothetical protein